MVLPHNVEIVLRPQITVTSLHPMYWPINHSLPSSLSAYWLSKTMQNSVS